MSFQTLIPFTIWIILILTSGKMKIIFFKLRFNYASHRLPWCFVLQSILVEIIIFDYCGFIRKFMGLAFNIKFSWACSAGVLIGWINAKKRTIVYSISHVWFRVIVHGVGGEGGWAGKSEKTLPHPPLSLFLYCRSPLRKNFFLSVSHPLPIKSKMAVTIFAESTRPPNYTTFLLLRDLTVNSGLGSFFSRQVRVLSQSVTPSSKKSLI